MADEKEKKDCCCGDSAQSDKTKPQAACCGPAADADGKININAACCAPSSPGLAKVRIFILAFFVIAAIIVLVYGSMK